MAEEQTLKNNICFLTSRGNYSRKKNHKARAQRSACIRANAKIRPQVAFYRDFYNYPKEIGKKLTSITTRRGSSSIRHRIPDTYTSHNGENHRYSTTNWREQTARSFTKRFDRKLDSILILPSMRAERALKLPNTPEANWIIVINHFSRLLNVPCFLFCSLFLFK